MLRKLLIWSAFGLVVGAALGLSTDPVSGEIEVRGDQPSKPAAAELATGVPGESQTLQIQCWQNGIKIIDETGLDGVRVRDLIERGGVGLDGDNWEFGDVNIIPINDSSTCLIRPVL